jgi:hypothetical protein
MAKIEIGAGFLITALSGFGLFQNVVASIVLLCIGLVLIGHGCFEEFFRPYLLLEGNVKRWLLNRNWMVKAKDISKLYYFAFVAEDEFKRSVTIIRDKHDKHVLTFTALIPIDKAILVELEKLSVSKQRQLTEDIRIYFTSKNMGYWDAKWPLNEIKVQTALPIDSQISEHLIDVKAKEIINTQIGVHSIVRKAIAPQI